MSKFKRTEIIKFPNQNASEDADKLYWSKLSDEFTIQGRNMRFNLRFKTKITFLFQNMEQFAVLTFTPQTPT